MYRPKSSGIATAAVLMVSVTLGLAPFDAQGIVRRDDVADADYVDFGKRFPAVGALFAGTSRAGSGALIYENGAGDSRWVLTAAHITTPTRFVIAGEEYDVEEFIKHPGYEGGTGGPPGSGIADDIALARLSLPVADVTPLPWHDNDDSISVGTDVISVGLGLSGTGLTGEVGGTAGTRRAAENTIRAIGSPSPMTPVATAFEYRFRSPGTEGVLPLEGMAVLFDSGGPVVADFGAGWTIIGVHSYVRNNSGTRGTYGDDLGATRVPLYNAWIMETVPEPSTLALFGGAAMALAAARRRLTRASGRARS